MVLLVALLPRRPDLTRKQFLEHWLERHGPLIRETPEIARYIHRYEQHVGLDPSDAYSGKPEFDGITLQWFASLDDFKAFIADPAYAVINQDEERFLDRDRIQWRMVHEPVVVIGDESPP